MKLKRIVLPVIALIFFALSCAHAARPGWPKEDKSGKKDDGKDKGDKSKK